MDTPTKQQFIPLFALQQRPLTILEALITYLREERTLSYHDIAKVINRDERNIRDGYIKAKQKQNKQYKDTTNLPIPLIIFTNRNLSPLEVLVSYLKEVYSFTYHEIAILLQRDDRTIWTVCRRISQKNKKREKQ